MGGKLELGRRDLAERDSAIVRRDALMPVWPKSGRSQMCDANFQEKAVLETSACKRDFLAADRMRG
jgi:hypothetical protein